MCMCKFIGIIKRLLSKLFMLHENKEIDERTVFVTLPFFVLLAQRLYSCALIVVSEALSKIIQ